MEHINKYILEEYVLMHLSEEEEFEVQEHLMNCDECSEFVHQLRLISQKNQRLHEEWVESTKKTPNSVLIIDWFRKYKEPMKLVASVLLLIAVGYSGLQVGKEYSSNEINLLPYQDTISKLKKELSFAKQNVITIVDTCFLIKTETKVETIVPSFEAITQLQGEEFKITDKDKREEFIKNLPRADISSRAEIDSADVKGLNGKVFIAGSEITLYNSSGNKAKIEILNYSFKIIKTVEYTNDTNMILDNIGICYFRIEDNAGSFVAGGEFYIIPKH